MADIDKFLKSSGLNAGNSLLKAGCRAFPLWLGYLVRETSCREITIQPGSNCVTICSTTQPIAHIALANWTRSEWAKSDRN